MIYLSNDVRYNFKLSSMEQLSINTLQTIRSLSCPILNKFFFEIFDYVSSYEDNNHRVCKFCSSLPDEFVHIHCNSTLLEDGMIKNFLPVEHHNLFTSISRITEFIIKHLVYCSPSYLKIKEKLCRPIECPHGFSKTIADYVNNAHKLALVWSYAIPNCVIMGNYKHFCEDNDVETSTFCLDCSKDIFIYDYMGMNVSTEWLHYVRVPKLFMEKDIMSLNFSDIHSGSNIRGKENLVWAICSTFVCILRTIFPHINTKTYCEIDTILGLALYICSDNSLYIMRNNILSRNTKNTNIKDVMQHLNSLLACNSTLISPLFLFCNEMIEEKIFNLCHIIRSMIDRLRLKQY